MPDIIGQMISSKEDQERLRVMENVRRSGRDFIRVRYVGRALNPRFHGLYDVEVHEVRNRETNIISYESSEIPRVPEFRKDGLGNIITDILDCEINRFWLSRHLGDHIEIDDPRLRKAVFALKDVPYRVELSPLDELKRKREQLDRSIVREERMLVEREEKEQQEKVATEIAPAPAPSVPVQDPEIPQPSPMQQADRRVGRRKFDSDAINKQEEGAPAPVQ